MVQIVATLVSVLLGISALAVIGLTLAEEWAALTRAVAGGRSVAPPLPRYVRQVAPARRARILRINPVRSPLRAAA